MIALRIKGLNAKQKRVKPSRENFGTAGKQIE